MDDIYSLAKQIKKNRPNTSFGIELATVSNISPLSINIGGQEYKSTDWTIYEPNNEFKDVETENGVLSGTSIIDNSSVNYKKGTIKEQKMNNKYEIGDLLAVQQLPSGQSFIILCRLKRVK